MSTEILERQALADTDPCPTVGQSALARAEQMLGYRHPDRNHLVATGELAHALRVMGLKPFTRNSVERYKAAEAARHNDTFRNVVLAFPLVKAPAMMIGGIVMPVSIISLIAHLRGIENLGGSVDFAWGTWVPIFIVSTALLMVGLLGGHKIFAQWKRYQIKAYDGPIPEFAVATMVEIHQRVPRVKVSVDQLEVNEVPWDPFLIVKHGDEEYYVEVWAEPGYLQKRMA